MEYWRVMLKPGGENKAAECVQAGYIGTDTAIREDVGGHLSGGMGDFIRHFAPIYMQNLPGKNRIGAGLALGSLWKVAKGIALGDIVLSPDGDKFYVGAISGDYYYAEGQELFHRRYVKWLDKQIPRADMPESFRYLGLGTVVNVSHYAEDIKQLLGDAGASAMSGNPVGNAPMENPVVFALEKQLEGFLVHNWKNTSLGREYDIYEDEHGNIAQQYDTEAGIIDILAVSKDGKTLLVVELKKGDASDRTVGQILRYMGYAKSEIAEEGQQVRGVIIAANDDQRIKWALKAVDNVDFYRYKVAFEVEPD